MQLFENINEHWSSCAKTHNTSTKGWVILERVFLFSLSLQSLDTRSAIAYKGEAISDTSHWVSVCWSTSLPEVLSTLMRSRDFLFFRSAFDIRYFQSDTFPPTVHTKTIKNARRLLSKRRRHLKTLSRRSENIWTRSLIKKYEQRKQRLLKTLASFTSHTHCKGHEWRFLAAYQRFGVDG